MEVAIGRKRLDKGLLIFFLLNAVDCVVTWWCLSQGAGEANWYMVMLCSMPVWAMLSLKIGIVGLVALLIQRYRKSLFKPLCIGMGLVVAFNLVNVVSYLIGRFS